MVQLLGGRQWLDNQKEGFKILCSYAEEKTRLNMEISQLCQLFSVSIAQLSNDKLLKGRKKSSVSTEVKGSI